MGFRQNTYATVWSVEPVSDTYTKCRISISRKNKNTGEYETDFSGFVGFAGTAAARKAAALKPRDRIKLGDVDVTNRYDKEKEKEYISFKVFSFEIEESQAGQPHGTAVVEENNQEAEDDSFPF